MRVRFPPLPPNSPGVPGTKCGRGRVDRRRSVEPSTRIQFRPATPIYSGPSPTGQGPALRRLRFRFESGWAGQVVSSFGSEEDGKSAAFGPQRHWVRLPGSDQSFSGIAKLGRRRTVNADTRRFESCSRSHAGLTQTGRVPLLQSGCPWFDSRTPHQFSTLP